MTMISLQQIENDLKLALKARDQIKADTLRGLKTRIQNAQTSGAAGKELSEAEIIALVRSEVKRRKEAAESFAGGGRAEQAEKELKEAEILGKYLPAQLGEEQLNILLNEVIAQGNFTAADFGKAMGAAKAKVGTGADGGVISKLLKAKLK